MRGGQEGVGGGGVKIVMLTRAPGVRGSLVPPPFDEPDLSESLCFLTAYKLMSCTMRVQPCVESLERRAAVCGVDTASRSRVWSR